MPKYLSQIDASRIPIKGLVPESSATAPSSPVEGQLYYDTTLKTNRSYQDGSWVNISQGGTYAVPSQAEAEAGTATTGRVFSAQRVAQAINALQAVKSVAGKTGVVALVKGDVGLSNVDNTADSAKPVSTAQQTALNLKAPLASPALTGAPTAPTPTATTGIANKGYVDARDAIILDQAQNYANDLAMGFKAKDSVRVATTANITLSGTQTIDGIATVAGNRVLVKNQTNASQNGIYFVSSAAWFRTEDANSWVELISAFVFVEQGTSQADTGWLCTADAGGTLGTTPLPWTQFSSSGEILAGTGLTKAGNTISIADDGVGFQQLANLSVSTVKLSDNSVTEAKLGSIPLTSSKLTSALPINKGGTAATTATAARINLGAVGTYSNATPKMTPGTWYNVTHNLYNINPTVVFIDSLGEQVILDWKVNDANSISIRTDVSWIQDSDIQIGVIG